METLSIADLKAARDYAEEKRQYFFHKSATAQTTDLREEYGKLSDFWGDKWIAYDTELEKRLKRPPLQ